MEGGVNGGVNGGVDGGVTGRVEGGVEGGAGGGAKNVCTRVCEWTRGRRRPRRRADAGGRTLCTALWRIVWTQSRSQRTHMSQSFSSKKTTPSCAASGGM